jgi:hypothetical protein
MTSCEGLAFFDIFLNQLRPIRDPHENDNAWNSCSQLGGAESRFNWQSFVKKWHVANPKMNFLFFWKFWFFSFLNIFIFSFFEKI